ncbi:YidB family protein [Hydrogenophaga sp. XSHU_21]
MGLLDGLLGGGAAGAPSAAGGVDMAQMMALVGQLLQQSGGLEGLLAKLQAGGLGEAAQSWVGTGANQPVSPDALGGALGPDLMATLGGLLGGNGAQASSVLAQVLPGLVDQLTPQGRVPEAGAGGIDPMSALGSLMGGPGAAGGQGGGPDLGSLLGGLLRR